MNNVVHLNKKEDKYFKNVHPIKITESNKLKVGHESWGIITDFYLESVKVNCYKPNQRSTTVVIKVSDEAGQVVCVAKGRNVGLFFGVTQEEWTGIENLCQYQQQLYYREFKDGLSKSYRCEQKLFFNFCRVNQTSDALVVKYKRGVNTRNKDRDDILLNVTHISKCTNFILDLYTYYLHQNTM